MLTQDQVACLEANLCATARLIPEHVLRQDVAIYMAKFAPRSKEDLLLMAERLAMLFEVPTVLMTYRLITLALIGVGREGK